MNPLRNFPDSCENYEEPLELQLSNMESEKVQERLCWEVSDLKKRLTKHNKENNDKMDQICSKIEDQKKEILDIVKDQTIILKELSDRVLTLEVQRNLIVKVVAFMCGTSTVASGVCAVIALVK